MSAYCTQENLLVRFGSAELLGIADRDGDGVVDADVVTSAIETASSIIDSYIGTRYALPLVTVPATLKAICEDLARHALYTVEPMKIVTDNRDAAIARLKDISRGIASLDVPTPPPASFSDSGIQIMVDGLDRSTSRAELRKL
jgi:phage gp36-like protein